MTLSPSLRKLVLTLHVLTTMGWLGAAAAYIPIAAYVLSHQDAQLVRSAVQIMDLVANLIVVPVAFASLLTGAALALGTKWGLFRHYWITFKLIFTIFAVFMLVAYTQELGHAASIAANRTLTSEDLRILQSPIHIIHPTGGLLIVVLATVLSVYKPKGLTRYGWRKQQEIKRSDEPYMTARWIKSMIGVAIALIVFTVILFVII